MSLRPLLVVLLAGAAASAQAQEAGNPLARLPDKLFGIDCRVSSIGEAATSICLPRDLGRGPIVGVTSADIGRDATYEEIVEQMRDSFHESGIREIVEEQPFAVASAPGAVTMRGIYQTMAGRKFTWSAAYRGNLTRVIITVPDNAKIKDFDGEVMSEVFGPDRYVADASTAP